MDCSLPSLAVMTIARKHAERNTFGEVSENFGPTTGLCLAHFSEKFYQLWAISDRLIFERWSSANSVRVDLEFANCKENVKKKNQPFRHFRQLEITHGGGGIKREYL